MNKKIYIYGIVFNKVIKSESIQVEDTLLSFVPYKDISAVVSEEKELVLTENTSKQLVAQQLLKHQKLIEKIMDSGYTIIPMKLATYLEDDNAVLELLETSYNLVKKLELEINNKIEVDIVATWADFNEVIVGIANNETVKEAKIRLSAKAEGVTSQDQQELGFLISKIIKANNQALTEKCYKILEKSFLIHKEHDVMNDQMIFNTSFLVNRSEIEKFNDSVNSLDEQLEGKLNFRYVGPLPCYSFYSLETVFTDFNKLIEAKEILELNESADLNEIKKSYKEKVFINHPDKIGEHKANEKFNLVNKTYKFLMDYFKAAKATEPEFEKIDFSKDILMKKKLLVKLKD